MENLNLYEILFLRDFSVGQTREGAVYQETREVVTINEWTDRVYQNTMQEHIITNVVSGRKMRIQKYNFPDTGQSIVLYKPRRILSDIKVEKHNLFLF